MKKLFLILFIATLTASCTDDSNDLQLKIINLVVNKKDWVVNTNPDGSNRFYSYNIKLPEISSAVFNRGTLTTYVVLDNAQQALPYVRHFEEKNTQDNTWYTWTRTVDCDYAVNEMNIYVTNSDFAENDIPGTMNFRVVLMW